MFEDSLVESGGQLRTKKGKTVFLSALIHTSLIFVGIVVPLIYTDQIEARHLITFLTAPPPPPSPPAIPEPQTAPPAVITVTQVDPGAFITPTSIPPEIVRIVDDVRTETGVPGGTRASLVQNMFRDILKRDEPEAAPVAAPPPPPPPPPAAVPTVVRVSSFVTQGNALYRPAPPYPALAKIAGIRGIVVLEAVISKEGSIKDLRVISGHPLLTQAATDAVRTWQYRPTLLNGEPVDVITTVTVNFSLAR